MQHRPSILVVEDEAPMRDLIKKILRKKDYAVSEAKSVATAHSQLKEKTFDLILMDLTLPDGWGLDILDQISEEYRNRVIIVSGTGTVDMAVEAMRKGAYDFLTKPLDFKVLLVTVKKALEVNRKLDDFRILKDKLSDRSRIDRIVSRSRNMGEVIKKATECALSNKTILITGETGTGKELIARAIHHASERKQNPFITVNCSAIPINLAESELFGFDKGAFTGADKAYPGKFFLADRGTIFLDEIGDLSHSSQVKLLRLLQEHEYFPIGSDIPRFTDAHIIASTNRNIEELLESGQFRKDLYYRLDVHHVHIPPLREHRDDIPMLVDFFLEGAAEQYGKKKPTPPRELFVLLENYAFPGNIRELRAMIYNAVSAHTSGVLSMQSFRKVIDIKQKANQNFSGEMVPEEGWLRFLDPLPTLKQAERLLIREALKQSKGNQTIAAGLLGITRQTLINKLKKEPENE